MNGVFFIQQNFVVGDIKGNQKLILEGARAAHAAGAEVALTPELALTGYTPDDLLFSPDLQRAAESALLELAAAVPPALAVLVGAPLRQDGKLYNACALLRNGAVEGIYKKSCLPNTSVFDERRYFTAADEPPLVFESSGKRYAVQICEDIWSPEQVDIVRRTGAHCLLVINGSPFVVGKRTLRLSIVRTMAVGAGCAVCYANSVGGKDELVFDGASFVMNAEGELTGQLPAFAVADRFADEVCPYPDDWSAIESALRMGLADYARKSRLTDGVALGLSGGVDSALVAALAVDALGAEQVNAVMMPTRHTSAASLEDARLLADRLGVRLMTLPLEGTLAGVKQLLTPSLRTDRDGVTFENIQSRLRGLLLMALSNNHHWLLLATGNKSELAYGYATLYGDMNGGFAPIKDVLKTQVWELSRRLNQRAGEAIIPWRVIERPPSAELKDNQTDQDSLPPYETVDALLTDYQRHENRRQMEERHGKATVAEFYRRLHASEHKRHQAPPGTKISDCAFGRDWRMPIAGDCHFSEF